MRILVDNVGITIEEDPQVGVIANNYVPRWDVTNLVTGNIYNDPAGNIGIGTTNPAYKLDVDGSANINGPLSVRGILSVTGTNIIQVMGTNILTMWPHRNMVTNLNADMVDGKHANELGGVIDHGSLLGLADDDHTQYSGAGWDTTTTLKTAQNHIARRDNPHSVTLGQLGHSDNNPEEEAPGYGTRGEPTREEIELWGDRYDDVGITAETDPQVGANTANYVPRWDGSALVKGSIYDPGTGDIGIPGGTIQLGSGDFRIQTPNDGSGYPQFLALRSPGNDTVLVPGYYGFRVTDRVNLHNNLILDNSGNLWIRDTYYPTSDSRTKANQEPLDYGLAEVLKLHPMRFVRVDWTMDQETGEIEIDETTGEKDFGLIAQDVYEIMPETVKKPEDESTGYWGLAYDKLIAVLAKAIQEQQVMIDKQKEINEAQDAKITSLEERITALEQK